MKRKVEVMALQMEKLKEELDVERVKMDAAPKAEMNQ